jgi:SAM-dependent methyltransferase
VDVSAGGGYLSERAGISRLPRAQFSCDASLAFLRSGSDGRRCVAGSETLPFSPGAFDAAACLAALHHAEDPVAICRELLRVVSRGGRAALGDVAEGSPASRYLNGFVDRHTEAGHHGRFYSLRTLGDFFASAGGCGLRAEQAELRWVLPTRADAVDFFRCLFGLLPSATDAEIDRALGELGAAEDGGAFRVPWTMHFVSASRA